MLGPVLRLSAALAAPLVVSLALSASLLTACSNDDVTLGTADEDAGTSPDAAGLDAGDLPACTIPAGLEKADADLSVQCVAHRALLECEVGDGIVGTCFSDDSEGTQCLPEDMVPAGSECFDTCDPDEYAAACGFGSGEAPDPPAGCRLIGADAIGTSQYCCSCGS